MEPEYQLDIDVHKMCRCCLTVDEKDLKTFFSNNILDGAVVAFPKIYKNVTEIETKKDDKLPQGICASCKAKISEFHLFKQRCINSNNLLCKILDVPSSVKSLEKPPQTDQATQSTGCDTSDRGTQTIEKVESAKLCNQVPDHNNKTSAKTVDARAVKHEVEIEEGFIDQEAVEVEDYVLDYESEYLSPDNLYVIGDDSSPVEENEDPFVDTVEYKIEGLENDRIEVLESLDASEAYSIVEPTTSPASKRTKKSIETCNICKTKVKSSHIKSHRISHQRSLPTILDSIPYFRCGRCKTVFSELSHLESHFANGSCSSSVDEPNCTDYQYLEDFPECEEEGPFSGCRTLRLCSVLQTSDDTLTCELCFNFSSSNVHDILVHCVTHFSNDKENNVVYYDETMPGPHRCGVCQLNQSSLSAALRHVFFHLSSFICPHKDCDDKFADFKSLNMHFEQFHMAKESVNDQQCMHCGYIAENYQAFRQHQWKECEKKIHQCEVCEKKFFHKTSLSMHMKYHLIPKYQCDDCKKTFSQSCDLKVHRRIHTGEKPYKCEHCDKSFRSISNRKDHMSTHRTDKLFACEICSQTFKSERTLRGHYPIHNATKKFPCTQCDKSFHRRFHLSLHMKSHERRDYRIVSTAVLSSPSA